MSNIIGFSKGLYSSWFYHSPTRSLFDCGEGCASHLGNKVYAVENIFLSHGHMDHISGIPTFINIRHSGRGDNEKPLNIYYPTGTREIESLRKYIEDAWHSPLSYQLNWIRLEPSQEVNDVVTFKTYHCRSLSLGYKVVDKRKRLKSEYNGQDISDLIRRGMVDKANLMEFYIANSFVYSLDSNSSIADVNVKGAKDWIADCTFLSSSDRDANSHGTIQEMVEIAYYNKVETIHCAHFSPRYDKKEIDNVIKNLTIKYANALKINPVYFSSVVNI